MGYHKGYAQIIDPASFIELDTITCCHCNKVEAQRVGNVAPAWCRNCQKPVCESCHTHGICRPFEQWLEKVEANERQREMWSRLGIR